MGPFPDSLGDPSGKSQKPLSEDPDVHPEKTTSPGVAVQHEDFRLMILVRGEPIPGAISDEFLARSSVFHFIATASVVDSCTWTALVQMDKHDSWSGIVHAR